MLPTPIGPNAEFYAFLRARASCDCSAAARAARGATRRATGARRCGSLEVDVGAGVGQRPRLLVDGHAPRRRSRVHAAVRDRRRRARRRTAARRQPPRSRTGRPCARSPRRRRDRTRDRRRRAALVQPARNVRADQSSGARDGRIRGHDASYPRTATAGAHGRGGHGRPSRTRVLGVGDDARRRPREIRRASSARDRDVVTHPDRGPHAHRRRRALDRRHVADDAATSASLLHGDDRRAGVAHWAHVPRRSSRRVDGTSARSPSGASAPTAAPGEAWADKRRLDASTVRDDAASASVERTRAVRRRSRRTRTRDSGRFDESPRCSRPTACSKCTASRRCTAATRSATSSTVSASTSADAPTVPHDPPSRVERARSTS